MREECLAEEVKKKAVVVTSSFLAQQKGMELLRAQVGQRVIFGLISKRRRKREVEGTS